MAIHESVEMERVQDGRVIGGEAPPSATIQKARRRREPRRSGHRSQDPKSLAEMVDLGALQDSDQIEAVANLLDQGRGTGGERASGDVGVAGEATDRPLSFLALVSGVSFNADGECKVGFESFDLENVIQLRTMRGLTLKVTVCPA